MAACVERNILDNGLNRESSSEAGDENSSLPKGNIPVVDYNGSARLTSNDQNNQHVSEPNGDNYQNANGLNGDEDSQHINESNGDDGQNANGLNGDEDNQHVNESNGDDGQNANGLNSDEDSQHDNESNGDVQGTREVCETNGNGQSDCHSNNDDQVEDHSDERNDIASNNQKDVEQDSKKILEKGLKGKVKWFNVKMGFGFIMRDDNKSDVFVHQTGILKNNPKKLLRSVGKGESVEFDIASGKQGVEAISVTGPNGSAVKGSVYAADKPRKHFYPRRSQQKSNENAQKDKPVTANGSNHKQKKGKQYHQQGYYKRDTRGYFRGNMGVMQRPFYYPMNNFNPGYCMNERLYAGHGGFMPSCYGPPCMYGSFPYNRGMGYNFGYFNEPIAQHGPYQNYRGNRMKYNRNRNNGSYQNNQNNKRSD